MHKVYMIWGCLAIVLATSVAHFGWEGIGVVAALWLLMPETSL